MSNLGAGVVILETSFGPLHHQLNSHQIYISGDKNLKFEHKRSRIDQDTACSVNMLVYHINGTNDNQRIKCITPSLITI
jgi:hypothetical protein